LEHKKNFFLAFLWTLAIAVACLVSMNEVPNVTVYGKDKTVHAFFYFVFSILWFLFLSKEMPKWTFVQKALFVIISSFLYGGIIEISQGQFTDTRKADVYDVIANVSGSIVGILVLYLMTKSGKNGASKNSTK
jgi:VanZ family protein